MSWSSLIGAEDGLMRMTSMMTMRKRRRKRNKTDRWKISIL
jgi:hypothetical protein